MTVKRLASDSLAVKKRGRKAASLNNSKFSSLFAEMTISTPYLFYMSNTFVDHGIGRANNKAGLERVKPPFQATGKFWLGSGSWFLYSHVMLYVVCVWVTVQRPPIFFKQLHIQIWASRPILAVYTLWLQQHCDSIEADSIWDLMFYSSIPSMPLPSTITGHLIQEMLSAIFPLTFWHSSSEYRLSVTTSIVPAMDLSMCFDPCYLLARFHLVGSVPDLVTASGCSLDSSFGSSLRVLYYFDEYIFLRLQKAVDLQSSLSFQWDQIYGFRFYVCSSPF